MSRPVRGRLEHSAECRWQTISYALQNNARTVRLCVIMLVPSVPLSLVASLIRR